MKDNTLLPVVILLILLMTMFAIFTILATLGILSDALMALMLKDWERLLLAAACWRHGWPWQPAKQSQPEHKPD